MVLYGPRRLGEVMQWPAMVGALLGILLCLKTMPRRVMLGLIAAIAALIAFAIMGAAGLAIIPRYTMLAASILFIFAAASVLGWRLLEPGHKWRKPWQVAAVLVVLLYIAWLPNQYDLLSKVDRDLSNQSLVERDLEALVDEGAFTPPAVVGTPGRPGSEKDGRGLPPDLRTQPPGRPHALLSGWTCAPRTSCRSLLPTSSLAPDSSSPPPANSRSRTSSSIRVPPVGP